MESKKMSNFSQSIRILHNEGNLNKLLNLLTKLTIRKIVVMVDIYLLGVKIKKHVNTQTLKDNMSSFPSFWENSVRIDISRISEEIYKYISQHNSNLEFLRIEIALPRAENFVMIRTLLFLKVGLVNLYLCRKYKLLILNSNWLLTLYAKSI